MSVLTIRAHRRYAVRRAVELSRSGKKAVKGLLIELSCEGARISNLGQFAFAPGDEVLLHLDGGTPMAGTVRWSHDGLAGIRLAQALHARQLAELLDGNRSHLEMAAPRYGT